MKDIPQDVVAHTHSVFESVKVTGDDANTKFKVWQKIALFQLLILKIPLQNLRQRLVCPNLCWFTLKEPYIKECKTFL